MVALLGGSTGSARLELRVSVGEARRGAVFFEDLLYSARDRRRSPRHVHGGAQRAQRREPQHGREQGWQSSGHNRFRYNFFV